MPDKAQQQVKIHLPFGRPDFSQLEIDAVSEVLRSGWIGMGNQVIEFEKELASFIQAKNLIAVSSCTDALFLSLRALGVGPGDEVICPSLTWCSSVNAGIYLGATPIFCDIDIDTLSLCPNSVLQLITPRTRAVIVVHMGGLATDVKNLRKILPPQISLVEDAAHALGARYPDGQPVGSSGNPTCFSFYANKNLSTGEGGAIAVADPEIAARCRSLRQHGQSADAWRRYQSPASVLVSQISEIGYKMNFTDLQAAIGRVQLRRQEEFAARRMSIAQRYVEHLCCPRYPLSYQRDILSPNHARHLVVTNLPKNTPQEVRDRLILALRNRGIGASLHYLPLHLHPAYRQVARGRLDNTDEIAGRILTLPISASMTLEDTDEVIAQTQDILSNELRL